MADNSKPVYLKLRDIIAASILDGLYAEGDMLPSVRAFAAEQHANPRSSSAKLRWAILGSDPVYSF